MLSHCGRDIANFCVDLHLRKNKETKFVDIKCLTAVTINLPLVSKGTGKEIPSQAPRVPGGCGCLISRQSAHEGGKVVSRTHRPPLPPRKYSWYSFLLETESTPGLMTPSGIEPATFRLVAQ